MLLGRLGCRISSHPSMCLPYLVTIFSKRSLKLVCRTDRRIRTAGAAGTSCSLVIRKVPVKGIELYCRHTVDGPLDAAEWNEVRQGNRGSSWMDTGGTDHATDPGGSGQRVAGRSPIRGALQAARPRKSGSCCLRLARNSARCPPTAVAPCDPSPFHNNVQLGAWTTRGIIGIPVCLDKRAVARDARSRNRGSLAPVPDSETLKFASVTTLVPLPEVNDAGSGTRGRVVPPDALRAKRATDRKTSQARVVYRNQ
jgi:hypothetical protein